MKRRHITPDSSISSSQSIQLQINAWPLSRRGRPCCLVASARVRTRSFCKQFPNTDMVKQTFPRLQFKCFICLVFHAFCSRSMHEPGLYQREDVRIVLLPQSRVALHVLQWSSTARWNIETLPTPDRSSCPCIHLEINAQSPLVPRRERSCFFFFSCYCHG